MSAITSTDELSIKNMPFAISEAREALTEIGQKFLYTKFGFDFANVTS